MLYLSHIEKEVSVLGPGKRFVLWVQGCKKHCKGCIFPSGQYVGEKGYWMNIDTIYDEIVNVHNLTGITISGGEPFLQASAVSRLVCKVKMETSLDIMIYSGYTLAELHNLHDDDIESILCNIDILIDGEYVEELNTNSIYRGSDNQVIHILSDKYKPFENIMKRVKSRNVEFTYNNDELFMVGIPEKNFQQKFWTLLNQWSDREDNKK